MKNIKNYHVNIKGKDTYIMTAEEAANVLTSKMNNRVIRIGHAYFEPFRFDFIERLEWTVECDLLKEKGMIPNTLHDADDLMDHPPELYTGDQSISFPGDYDENPDILIVQDQPLPLNILAIIPEMGVHG